MILKKIGALCLAGIAAVGVCCGIAGCGEKKNDVPEPEETQISIERIHEIATEAQTLLEAGVDSVEANANSETHLPFYYYLDGAEGIVNYNYDMAEMYVNREIEYDIKPMLMILKDLTNQGINYGQIYKYEHYDLLGMDLNFVFTINAKSLTRTELNIYRVDIADGSDPFLNMSVDIGVGV